MRDPKFPEENYISADKLSSKSTKASVTAKIGNFVRTFWWVIFAVIYPTKIISSTLGCYHVAIRRPSFFFLVVRASNGAQWCCEPCNWESSHIKSYDCPKGTLKTSIFLDYRTISSQKLKQNKLMYSREFIERYSQRIFLFFEWCPNVQIGKTKIIVELLIIIFHSEAL